MVHFGCVVFRIHMGPMDCSCMINFIIGKKIKHLSKYWGVVNTGRPVQVKYCGVAIPATPAALTPMDVPTGFRGKAPRRVWGKAPEAEAEEYSRFQHKF